MWKHNGAEDTPMDCIREGMSMVFNRGSIQCVTSFSWVFKIDIPTM